MQIKTFIPDFSIKAFDPSILIGFPRRNEMPMNPISCSPAHNRYTLEFWAIIGHDDFRNSPGCNQYIKDTGDSLSGKSIICFKFKTFPCTRINRRKTPNSPATCQSIMHEIKSPYTIRFLGNWQRLRGRLQAPGFAAILQLQLSKAIQSVYSLMVHVLACITDHIINPRHTPSWKSFRYCSYTFHKPFIRRFSLGKVMVASHRNPSQKACSAYCKPQTFQCVNNPPTLRTLYQFFFNTSRIASISKSRSATIRFNRPFSTSNSRNRRTSETPIPENLLRQLKKVVSLIPCRRQVSLIFPP